MTETHRTNENQADFLFGVIGDCRIATAIVVTPFQGWDWVKEKSSDIIIARCSETPSLHYADDLIYARIEVTAVLKGTNSVGPAILWTQFRARQGEDYLIFGDYHDGTYQAIEKYRIVPLGLNILLGTSTKSFDTNAIAGKPLDEQIQTLLKRRLDHLNRQIKDEQEEVQRLEPAIKK